MRLELTELILKGDGNVIERVLYILFYYFIILLFYYFIILLFYYCIILLFAYWIIVNSYA